VIWSPISASDLLLRHLSLSSSSSSTSPGPSRPSSYGPKPIRWCPRPCCIRGGASLAMAHRLGRPSPAQAITVRTELEALLRPRSGQRRRRAADGQGV